MKKLASIVGGFALIVVSAILLLGFCIQRFKGTSKDPLTVDLIYVFFLIVLPAVCGALLFRKGRRLSPSDSPTTNHAFDHANEDGASQQLSFVTGELTFFQKLCQVYWVNPRSWLLDRLESDGTTITISRRNGAVDTIQPGGFHCTFGTDNYERREFKIQTTDGRKIRFKEIPGMLTEPEWEAIAELLGATESNWNKVLHTAREILEQADKLAP